MPPRDSNSDVGSGEETIDEMMEHLEPAKASKQRQAENRDQAQSKLQRSIVKRNDPAILASNFESRLEEIVENEAVTHRSSKAWRTAKIAVGAHGRLPIYYRLDGEITHTGYISDIVLEPDEETDRLEKLLEHISDADTYDNYNDELDTTNYIVTGGKRLEEPFPQSELRKLADGDPIDENYSRQPAYVRQRRGDFPDFSSF